MTNLREYLAAFGLRHPLEICFAEALARLGDERQPAVWLAAALTARADGRGHVCLDLNRLAGRPADTDPGAALCPPAREWLTALADSPVVRTSDELLPGRPPDRPLVLDPPTAQLYLARHWHDQAELAADLRRLALHPPPPGPSDPPDRLARLFPPGPHPEGSHAQRQAAQRAADRCLAVITGGPGTGKTTLVVRLLALLQERARSAGHLPLRVLLAAPTGKAAARLGAAVTAARPTLDCDPAVAATLPDSASTLHRLLGIRPDRPNRFRRDRRQPLAADLVVVDEASMIDLALMARLAEAIPPGARLVLLGDADQLLSVETGSILGDICRVGPTSPIAPCLARLTHSFRFGHHSAIGRLAATIHAGQTPNAESAEPDPAMHGVCRHTPRTPADLDALLDPLLTAWFDASPDDPQALLGALGRWCLLCAHRDGPWGVTGLNARVERRLAHATRIRLTGQNWYAGQPIMITRNEPALDLFNGDLGRIVAEPGHPGRLTAVFADPVGGIRLIPPARLPSHETAWALTIHKSQGSEWDRVLVVLPPPPSPLLSRELLYTAITRARLAVSLAAPAGALAGAAGTLAQRASGLTRLLDAPGGGA